MKRFRFMMSIILVLNCHFVSLSQSNTYSTITKNINSQAVSLVHNLKIAGDTLLLKSDFPLPKLK